MIDIIRSMAAHRSLLFYVVLLLVCGCLKGLEITAEPGQNVTVRPGDNVTLTCKAEDSYSVVLILEWRKDGTETKKLLVIRDGRLFAAGQHESFRNRVFLKDPQMKDGDLSVVLKNMEIEDSGTYQCRVGHENDPDDSPLKLISIIDLSVVPPGEEGGQKGGGDDGVSRGPLGLIVLPVLLAVLVLVVLWISKKKKGSNQSSRGSNKHHIPESDHLNSKSY